MLRKNFNNTTIQFINILLAAVMLAGCVADTPAPTATQIPTATVQPLTATPLPSSTSTMVPPTTTPFPTETPPPTPVPPTATLAATLPPEQAILVYYIQKDSAATPVKKQKQQKESKQSCSNDAMMWINTGLPRSGNLETDISVALTKLFEYHAQYRGALYNPVYSSTFGVVSVKAKDGGLVVIQLSGSYVKSDDKCDKGRVRSQIWSTIRQFEGVKTIEIYVGDALLGDVLAVTG